nr:MAG TPA: hypothetical protein [Caudoviricetes sp.]
MRFPLDGFSRAANSFTSSNSLLMVIISPFYIEIIYHSLELSINWVRS